MPPYSLTNFEIQEFYQEEPRFNGVYSRDNQPRIKDRAYVININEYSGIETHQIALNVQVNDVTYFDSFVIKYSPKEIKKLVGNKNIKINIFRIQKCDLIMCGHVCIVFINFMLAKKDLVQKCNAYETHNIYPNLGILLSDQQQFRLNKINEIKYYFAADIKKRELMNKRFSKYIAPFDYFEKFLIVSSVTTASISIASFKTVTGAHIGMVSAIFSLTFLVSIGIIKNLLKTTRSKKKNHNKIIIFARYKLNITESKRSQALINNESSHEDFMTIINAHKLYQELKENIRMINSQRSDV